MIPLVLPQVTTMVQKLLARGFPRLYKERLREADSDGALVSQVRRRTLVIIFRFESGGPMVEAGRVCLYCDRELEGSD